MTYRPSSSAMVSSVSMSLMPEKSNLPSADSWCRPQKKYNEMALKPFARALRMTSRHACWEGRRQ